MNFKEYLSTNKSNSAILSEQVTHIFYELTKKSKNDKFINDSPNELRIFDKCVAKTSQIMTALISKPKGRYIVPLANTQEAAIDTFTLKNEARNKIKLAGQALLNSHDVIQLTAEPVSEYFIYVLNRITGFDFISSKHEIKHFENISNNTLTYNEYLIILKTDSALLQDRSAEELNNLILRKISGFKSRLNAQVNLEIANDSVLIQLSLSAVSIHNKFNTHHEHTPDEVLSRGIIGQTPQTGVRPHEVAARQHTIANQYIQELSSAILENCTEDSEYKEFVESSIFNLKRHASEHRQKNDNLNIGRYQASIAEFKTIYDSEEPIRIRAKLNELNAIADKTPAIQNQINGLTSRLNRLSNNVQDQDIALDTSARYDLVISNTPVDIFSMSSNKAWGSCQNTVSSATKSRFLTKIKSYILTSNNPRQTIIELLNDPVASRFYHNYETNMNMLDSILNRFSQATSNAVKESIIEQLFTVHVTHVTTYTDTHARSTISHEGAVMVLYVIPHVRRYIGGTRISDQDYDAAVTKALVNAIGRITLLPAVILNTNQLTFIPGTYANNSAVNISSFAYASGSTSISSHLNSNEQRSLKNAMIRFYAAQNLSESDVRHFNLITVQSDHYYDQGTVNAQRIQANNIR